ncbi:MAG: DUF883 C-terminal domain-containing protein [Chlorobiaceae bacterium]
MEQEVPITIHRGEQKDPEQIPQQDTTIPEKVKELGETLSEIFDRFRESESYEHITKSVEIAREYIRNNPAKAMCYSLGVGALLGFLMRKK